MGFLHIESYVAFLVLYHVYYKLEYKGCVMAVLHQWLDKEFLAAFL